MTRNTRDKFKETQSSSATSTTDNVIDLPDLSTFRDEEKQHILNVLERDESLRSKHLSRFMNLRKEVADLEQQSRQTSSSICARCQTPFGFIFNTGDPCPKCGAKVCKQCRLMYNVHDNGWLCQLCCKQMQLMSYSGEWLYSIRGTLGKHSGTPSQAEYDSLAYSFSALNSHVESSSDSELEDFNPSADANRRFNTLVLPPKPKPVDSNNKLNKMLVQSEIDEQKLKFIRDHIKKRPVNMSFTQPLTRRVHQLTSTSNTINSSSDDVNSLLNQPNTRQNQTLKKLIPTIPKEIEVVKPVTNENHIIEPNREEINRKSEASPERTDPIKKTKRPKLKKHLSRQSSTHGSKLSLESTSTVKSSHKHLSASMQNLRNAVHRISPAQLLASRTSLNAENKRRSVAKSNSTINDEDAISIQMPDIPSRLNIPTKVEPLQSSADQAHQSPEIHHQAHQSPEIHRQANQSPEIHRQESSSTTVSIQKLEPQSKQNLLSETSIIATTNHENNRGSRSKSVEPRGNTRVSRTASVGNRISNGDSDDDIDGAAEQVKRDTPKRASSFMDIRGSQLSINSAFSETKAHYDLDITGTIELKLSYNATTGLLNILIEKCTNLARAKRNQTSNPYCKIYLLPDQSKASKLKTTIKKHTIDPVFAEILRCNVSSKEFNSRIIWISVWSQATLGHNDFLGEIYIPLAHCTLDKLEEYTLLPRVQRDGATSTIEPTASSTELQFQLTFLAHGKDKESGTIQISAIQGKGIYSGKHNVDAICKGLLMPGKIKRKLPAMQKGPSPKWDTSLRWEQIRRKDLINTSVEISIWCQEHFRKTMIGLIRLNAPQKQTDKAMKSLDTTNEEKSVWELFLKEPTKIHYCQLPLRQAIHEK